MKIPSELLLLLSDPLMGPAITKFVEDVKAHVEYAERSTRALKLIEALVTENDEFSAVAREAIMAIVDPVLDAALAQNPAPEECTTAVWVVEFKRTQ